MNSLDITVKRAMLYDFYGELLTAHQKEIYESLVLDDVAPVEIANLNGISRQSVHELIKRCDKILLEYEEKLHLVEKFDKTRELVNSINNLTKQFKITHDDECIDNILVISEEILDNM